MLKPLVPRSTMKAVTPSCRLPSPVRAMTMTKSACGTRLTQILRPLITQSLPSLHRAGDHARGIAAGTRLGDGDRRLRLAACVRFQVFPALFRIGRRHQHVQVGAVGREGEGHAGAALFLIHADQRDGRQGWRRRTPPARRGPTGRAPGICPAALLPLRRDRADFWPDISRASTAFSSGITSRSMNFATRSCSMRCSSESSNIVVVIPSA